MVSRFTVIASPLNHCGAAREGGRVLCAKHFSGRARTAESNEQISFFLSSSYFTPSFLSFGLSSLDSITRHSLTPLIIELLPFLWYSQRPIPHPPVPPVSAVRNQGVLHATHGAQRAGKVQGHGTRDICLQSCSLDRRKHGDQIFGRCTQECWEVMEHESVHSLLE